MSKKATLKDLRGLRKWAMAIRMWQNDSAEILADYALTSSGFGVLLALVDDPRSSGDIRDELGMTTGGLAKLLKRLENEGRIDRSHTESDKRVVTVSLTEEGRSLLLLAGAELIDMRDAEYRRAGFDKTLQKGIYEAWEKIQSI